MDFWGDKVCKSILLWCQHQNAVLLWNFCTHRLRTPFCTPFWKSVDFTRIIIYYCFSDAVVDTTTFKIVLLSFLLACTQRCFWHGVFSSWLYVKSYVKLRRKKDKCLTMMEVIFIQLAVVWSVGVVKYRPFWLFQYVIVSLGLFWFNSFIH